MTDYEKYRGKCKEFSEALCAEDPTLTLVRGHYLCPYWGEQQHWWCTQPDGTIVDPTKDQFPSKGAGEYVPFDGTVYCEECGTALTEDTAIWMGRYPVCSDRCARSLVGV
jgi:hypothetical protein